MSKGLSHKKKMELLPLLIERDGAYCLYCKNKLALDEIIFEHLNGNRSDNRLENITSSCQSCNIKKITNADLQIIAKEKLKQNEDKNFLSERNFVEDVQTQNVSTEININVSNYEITKKYIAEIILTDGFILKSDALNSCVYLCKEKTGHGSHQSVRNYIDTLTSSLGPFMMIKDDDNKKLIVQRKGK